MPGRSQARAETLPPAESGSKSDKDLRLRAGSGGSSRQLVDRPLGAGVGDGKLLERLAVDRPGAALVALDGQVVGGVAPHRRIVHAAGQRGTHRGEPVVVGDGEVVEPARVPDDDGPPAQGRDRVVRTVRGEKYVT